MAGGIPIRFRRTVNDVPVDPAPIGTAFWHMLDYKLGIQSELGMCWYPGVDTKKKLFVLNQGQRLTGKTSGNVKNDIAIDFSTNGQMRVIDTDTDQVLASFSEAGVVLANPVVSSVVGGGSLSKGSHPGFVPALFPATTFDSDDYSGFIGPNSYLWKKSGNTGKLTTKIAYKAGGGAMTHLSAENYTLEVNVSEALNGIGLRSWFFEPSLAYDGNANKNKVFISVFGPSGQSNTIRVGRDGSYTELTILGNGAWQRVGIEIPVHARTQSYLYSSANEPFAIDFVYNTTGGIWYFSEPTVQHVDVITNELYQYKSLAERAAIADAYYWESPSIYMHGSNKKSIQLPSILPILHANAICDVVAVSSGQTLSVTEKTRNGFVLGTSDSSPASQWSAKVRMGYRGPLTDL